MYFFYVDESGNRNPTADTENPFVFVSIAIHEFRWRQLERNINARKLKLIADVHDRTGCEFDLSDVEVKANTLRVPVEREKHLFFKHLTKEELFGLTELMYEQLRVCKAWIHYVVLDKKCLREYLNTDKMSKKAYELLLERGERFIDTEHPNQNCIFVLDNNTPQLNHSMALKHSYFQREGTTSRLKLKHIVELPMFVDSRLSNGVQLADLSAYNVFRVFRDGNASYPYFRKILPFIYKSPNTDPTKLEGLKIFPENHRWKELVEQIKKQRTHLLAQMGSSL